MIAYHELILKHPDLFDNKNALMKIVLDQKVVDEWEANKEVELMQKGLPLEWAKLGVVLDDPYNIIVRDLVQFPDGGMRGYGRSIATASLKGGKATVVFPEYKGKILLIHLFQFTNYKTCIFS